MKSAFFSKNFKPRLKMEMENCGSELTWYSMRAAATYTWYEQRLRCFIAHTNVFRAASGPCHTRSDGVGARDGGGGDAELPRSAARSGGVR